MTQERKHSPLPWLGMEDTIEGHILGDAEKEIGWARFRSWSDLPDEQTVRENLRFAVHACNNHYKLVDALKNARHKVYTAAVLNGSDPEFASLACKELDAALVEAEAP